MRLQVFALLGSHVMLRYIADAPLEPAVCFNGHQPTSSSTVFESKSRMRPKTCSRGSSDGSCLRKRQRKSFTSCENLSRLVQPAPNRVLCTTLCRPCGIVSPGVDLTGRQFVAGVLACSRYVKSCRQSRQVRLSVADASEISERKFVKGTWRRQATATQQRPKRGKFKGKPDDPSAWLHDSLGQTVGKAIKMMKKQSRHELALEMMLIV